MMGIDVLVMELYILYNTSLSKYFIGSKKIISIGEFVLVLDSMSYHRTGSVQFRISAIIPKR